ncbi:helix-turn-helix domain-containing protein [Leekyejoonella antrihumi]|nr:helix-turn-helix transcriptional regulator [Leekyejoonella antrihumi]
MANTEGESSPGHEQALEEAAIDFGRRVKKLRRAAGLTQRQLADRLSQWGRSYHQTTIAKLEAGSRPTTLDELTPLAVALGVSQREFFDDPSPADRAEHKVREAEQEVLKLRTDLELTHSRFVQLHRELRNAVNLYSSRVSVLREYDPEGAAERRRAIEEHEMLLDELDAEAAVERRETEKDLADTWRQDQL